MINLNLTGSAKNSVRTLKNTLALDHEIGIWGTETKHVQGFVTSLCGPSRHTRIHLSKFQLHCSSCIRTIIRPNSNFYRMMKYRCCDFSQLAIIYFAVCNAKGITNLFRNRHFYWMNNFVRLMHKKKIIFFLWGSVSMPYICKLR